MIGMRGYEHADAESLAAVEAFLREATGEAVTLGTVRLATGRSGRIVTTVARARAITLGSWICFARGTARPHPTLEVQSALEQFGGLFIHECVHVWQYRREGRLSFLRQYLKSYFSGIWHQKSVGRRARQAAYGAIPYELEAFDLERRWLRRTESERGVRR